MAELINNLRAYGHLQPFYGIKYQQAQFAVEHIQVVNVIPRRTFLEGINNNTVLLFLVWQHVRTETIVTDIGEMPFGTLPVSYYQTSRKQQFHLLFIGQWRFVEYFHTVMNAKNSAKVLHFLVFQEFLLFIFYNMGNISANSCIFIPCAVPFTASSAPIPHPVESSH